MNPIVLSFLPDGEVRTVYTDEVPLASLGHMDVRRASDVEFNGESGLWEVRWAGSSEVVFTNASRAVCISWEVSQLNERLTA